MQLPLPKKIDNHSNHNHQQQQQQRRRSSNCSRRRGSNCSGISLRSSPKGNVAPPTIPQRTSSIRNLDWNCTDGVSISTKSSVEKIGDHSPHSSYASSGTNNAVYRSAVAVVAAAAADPSLFGNGGTHNHGHNHNHNYYASDRKIEYYSKSSQSRSQHNVLFNGAGTGTGILTGSSMVGITGIENNKQRRGRRHSAFVVLPSISSISAAEPPILPKRRKSFEM